MTYTDAAARDRMSRGRCPVCGCDPIGHRTIGNPVHCALSPANVVDLIEQYDADREADRDRHR